MKTALYLRCSVAERTIDNQRHALERHARFKGWQVVATFTDEATSGALPHNKRPGLSAALEAAKLGQFDVLACWDLSRLGRSLPDLLNIATLLHKANTDLVILNANIDTTTPTGRLTFHILGALAQFERELIVERTKASVRRRRDTAAPDALMHGPGSLLGGRCQTDPVKRSQALTMLAHGLSERRVARALKISRSTVSKFRSQLDQEMTQCPSTP